ncbi:hypothetical protein ACFLRN_04500 [Thermoproteota archaeon]
MKSDSIEFGICPNCSSTEYFENYPMLGKQICIKCGHESEKIKLKIIEKQKEILDTCPFCGKEGEEDDTLFDKDDILVFKCKKCGKLDGYRFFDFSDYYCEFAGSHDSLSTEIAKQEGSYIHPASKYREFKRALRKMEKDPLKKCIKQLHYLINTKRQEILAADISTETIRNAEWKAQFFIKKNGPLTNKKLNCLYSAVLLCISGNKLTERQLEKIFGVTRKTIRKWKKILPPNFVSLPLGVLVCNAECQPKHTVVKVPIDIKSIVKLEKTLEDKCHFCEKIELLSWCIQYVNGTWSNICQKSYERLNNYSLEYGWKIEEYLL